MCNIKDGELPKLKETCRVCGKQFITFEKIPGKPIRGRYYCCIEHTLKALEEDRKEAAKKLEKKSRNKKNIEKAAIIIKRECPVCGIKFTAMSESVIFCSKCKFIGWDKRNKIMAERKRQMRCLNGSKK